MKIEFGAIKEYNSVRGFGFVSRAFNNVDRRKNKNVYFHISTIKQNHPNLAKELDNDLVSDVYFWYEIDNQDRERVNQIWLDLNDVPCPQRGDLTTKIEQIWNNINLPVSDKLSKITVAAVGQSRKDELEQNRNALLAAKKEKNQKELAHALSLLEQQKKEKLQSIENSKKRITKRDEPPKQVYIGLPDHLSDVVLWVARKYRTNMLSHIPGGSDVVVEYHDGRALGYDWIKNTASYISSFFAGMVDYESDVFKQLNKSRQIEIAKNKIARVFARKYRNESERPYISFVEVWNSVTSDEMPWEALSRFDYYGYEPEDEDPVDKAERLWGIPDPRLLEI